MTATLSSQAKASFSVVAILQQVRKEPYASHLPGSTHISVKHSLLSVPSTSTLFSEEVIHALLTQVKDDSQLYLLKNLSSLKGGISRPQLLPPPLPPLDLLEGQGGRTFGWWC